MVVVLVTMLACGTSGVIAGGAFVESSAGREGEETEFGLESAEAVLSVEGA